MMTQPTMSPKPTAAPTATSAANALCAFKEGINNWPGLCTISGWNCSGATATTYPCGSGSTSWTGVTCDGNFVSQLFIDCFLIGTISPQLSTLTDLQMLIFEDNALNGTIPTELSVLTNLIALNFEDNSLTGTIPTELSVLINLEQLHLNQNYE